MVSPKESRFPFLRVSFLSDVLQPILHKIFLQQNYKSKVIIPEKSIAKLDSKRHNSKIASRWFQQEKSTPELSTKSLRDPITYLFVFLFASISTPLPPGFSAHFPFSPQLPGECKLIRTSANSKTVLL